MSQKLTCDRNPILARLPGQLPKSSCPVAEVADRADETFETADSLWSASGTLATGIKRTGLGDPHRWVPSPITHHRTDPHTIPRSPQTETTNNSAGLHEQTMRTRLRWDSQASNPLVIRPQRMRDNRLSEISFRRPESVRPIEFQSQHFTF